MKPGKIILIIIFAVLIAAFFLFDFGQYFNLEFIKTKQAEIDAFYMANPITAALSFFSIYVFLTGLSLPAAGIMTLIGGAIFGLVWGTVLVSFASSIGATLAFLVSRYLFRDIIQQKFSQQLKPINEGIEMDGGLYLFTLRLVPVFPFFIINLVMGLTPIRTITFFLVSQVGMLPASMIIINAGTQLAQINDPGDILSFNIIVSFALLGIFPLLAKKTVDFIQAKRQLDSISDKAESEL
jgi:uncharacterized membrane protein YdjX (TVP38/TMEM64 family)